VFAVGHTGSFPGFGSIILHYDGTTWTTQVETGSASDYLLAVWGSSPTDVYAVGVGGTILHYGGSGWSPQASGTAESLNSVWGASATDVFAVGSQGTVLHYDGVRWSSQTSATTVTLLSVWGSSGRDVYAVGTTYGACRSGCSPNEVATVHYCGTAWEPEPISAASLVGVGGTSPADVYVVGDSGTILRRNGGLWNLQPRRTTAGLVSIWGRSDAGAFAVGGGAILRGTH
jgi:hypothetical protein